MVKKNRACVIAGLHRLQMIKCHVYIRLVNYRVEIGVVRTHRRVRSEHACPPSRKRERERTPLLFNANRYLVLLFRRKKKCVRYMGEGGDGDGEADGEAEDDHSEDNLGSVGEAGTPEDDESLSSPGGLSALSSLASPSLVLPSPSSLASPCPCPLTPPVPPPPLPNTSQSLVATAAVTTTGAMTATGAAVTTAATVQQQQQSHPPSQPPHRNPVGTNPHDINNPLSVNQLTGQCIKSESAPSGPSNPAISVT